MLRSLFRTETSQTRAYRLVLAKFTQTIVRCRPITQTGAEQILLDLQALKTCLMHLVHAPGDLAPVPMS